jgi:hypothetical protein
MRSGFNSKPTVVRSTRQTDKSILASSDIDYGFPDRSFANLRNHCTRKLNIAKEEIFKGQTYGLPSDFANPSEKIGTTGIISLCRVRTTLCDPAAGAANRGIEFQSTWLAMLRRR